MQIHDPHACIARELDECETAAYTNGLTPVLSTKDDQWFAVSMLSGESHKLEDLEVDDLSSVREAIATHLFSKLLLSHCHQVRESEDMPNKGQSVLARADYARHFGTLAVEGAEQTALGVGFTVSDIARAYVLMESEDPAVDAPVTRVSDLQAEGGV